MSNFISRSSLAALGLLAGTLIASPVVSAKCGCPDDGNWTPVAARGLGQSFPEAADVAADPAWQVYEFERDGVRYIQVNDLSGTVRAAAGRIGGTFWVMPIGIDADRVAVQGDTLPVGSPRVLYRGADVEVVLYQDGARQRWLVRPRSAAQ